MIFCSGSDSNDSFRLTSESDQFPYAFNTTPFILIKQGKVRWANRKPAKRTLCMERGGVLLAVWPGKWGTDVFLIDDRKAALAAL